MLRPRVWSSAVHPEKEGASQEGLLVPSLVAERELFLPGASHANRSTEEPAQTCLPAPGCWHQSSPYSRVPGILLQPMGLSPKE